MAELNHKKIASLVERIKAGDSQAFADIYSQTYQKVYYFALSLVKDEHLAEDALQETYIKVLNSIDTLKDNKLFVAWLNRITYNICMRQLEKRREELGYEDEAEKLVSQDDDTNPLLYSIKSEENSELMRHILKLPESHRAVIILKFYNDMKTEEIAETLDIPPGTVKSRIHSAKKMLRESMSNEERS